jgi:hypothetical protein
LSKGKSAVASALFGRFSTGGKARLTKLIRGVKFGGIYSW